MKLIRLLLRLVQAFASMCVEIINACSPETKVVQHASFKGSVLIGGHRVRDLPNIKDTHLFDRPLDVNPSAKEPTSEQIEYVDYLISIINKKFPKANSKENILKCLIDWDDENYSTFVSSRDCSADCLQLAERMAAIESAVKKRILVYRVV